VWYVKAYPSALVRIDGRFVNCSVLNLGHVVSDALAGAVYGVA
jgi:hypothetical protein